MNTKPLQPGASRWRAFLCRLEKQLAHLINDLHLFASLLIARWIVKREVKRREAQQVEVGYETKKPKLLVALRRRFSEKRSKQ